MRKAWIIGLLVVLVDGALLTWWLDTREPPGPPTVSGVVLDPDGNPVRAGVWRLPWSDLRTPWGTDEDGRFVVPLVSGPFGLCATGLLPWAESEGMHLDGSEGRSIEDVVLRLRRPARVTGQVFDDAGQPLAGYLVICISGILVANDTEPMAYTDEEGRFALDDCDPGPGSIQERSLLLAEGETTEIVVHLSAEETREARERR